LKHHVNLAKEQDLKGAMCDKRENSSWNFDGATLRIKGMGEAGMNGGPSGDLCVAIYVAEDKHFERKEDDLYCIQKIPFTTAVLGGEIKIQTIDGPANLKIPVGT
jgi:molecular chaperone DnaJ